MLNKLRITTRLALGFGLLVLLIAISSALAVWQDDEAATAFAEAQRTASVVIGLKDTLLSVRQGRVMAWTYAATGDQSYIKNRDDAFAQFKTQMSEVEAMLRLPEGKQRVKDYTDAVSEFKASVIKMNGMTAAGVVPTAPEYLEAITAVNADAKHYAETNAKASKYDGDRGTAASGRANAQIQTSVTMAIGSGLVATLIGLLAALLIGRSIARPVGEMTGAMSRLAHGDLTVVIPALSNRDEIGEMAQAVQVFKDNAIDKQRLDEAEKTRLATERRRQQESEELIDMFGSSVSGVFSSLSEATRGMADTANLMK